MANWRIAERLLRDRLALNTKRIRESEGFSQGQTAKRAGLSLRSYQRIEEGGEGPTPPRLATIARVAVALGVDPSDLFQPILVS